MKQFILTRIRLASTPIEIARGPTPVWHFVPIEWHPPMVENRADVKRRPLTLVHELLFTFTGNSLQVIDLSRGSSIVNFPGVATWFFVAIDLGSLVAEVMVDNGDSWWWEKSKLEKIRWSLVRPKKVKQPPPASFLRPPPFRQEIDTISDTKIKQIQN